MQIAQGLTAKKIEWTFFQSKSLVVNLSLQVLTTENSSFWCSVFGVKQVVDGIFNGKFPLEEKFGIVLPGASFWELDFLTPGLGPRGSPKYSQNVV